MKRQKTRNFRIILLLLISAFILIAVPHKSEAAARYPFKYFKVGGKNIVKQINKDFHPAYFYDGVVDLWMEKKLRKGAKVTWKLNPGWHCLIWGDDDKPLKSGFRIKRTSSEYENAYGIYIWKGNGGMRLVRNGRGQYIWKGKRGSRKTYREIYYDLRPGYGEE